MRNASSHSGRQAHPFIRDSPFKTQHPSSFQTTTSRPRKLPFFFKFLDPPSSSNATRLPSFYPRNIQVFSSLVSCFPQCYAPDRVAVQCRSAPNTTTAPITDLIPDNHNGQRRNKICYGFVRLISRSRVSALVGALSCPSSTES